MHKKRIHNGCFDADRKVLSLGSVFEECRTKHPPDKTLPAHFGIGGQNTPHVFYRVDITPPATYERVDKTPLVSFARWTKSPLSCGQNPPQTESSVFIIAIEFWSLE